MVVVGSVGVAEIGVSVATCQWFMNGCANDAVASVVFSDFSQIFMCDSCVDDYSKHSVLERGKDWGVEYFNADEEFEKAITLVMEGE